MKKIKSLGFQTLILSSNLTIKFANKIKKNKIKILIHEYKNIMEQCIDLVWNIFDVPNLAPKSITDQIKTWMSARMIQCACKQAIAIVKGTKEKNRRRLFIIEKLTKEKRIKKAKALQRKLIKESKPNLKNVNPELDSRFISMDFDNPTSFDGWIIISSIGNNLKIKIPVKKSEHFNSMTGKLKSGIRLERNQITFIFEEEIKTRTKGTTVGLDIGILTIATLSDGQATNNQKSGDSELNLPTIIKELNSKKKGSLAYEKAQKLRTNYINWCINQINFDGVKILRIEDIKNIRKNRKCGKYLNRWTYTEIKSKIELTCLKLGVQVEHVNPTYTSQRCSCCGWVRKKNRDGKLFECDKCGFAADADLNGAINISLPLRPIGRKERLLHKNKTGFYWNEMIGESIVPQTQKLNLV